MSRDTPPHPDRERDRGFPAARSTHEAILDDPEAHPEGWVEQARFRDRYDLPPFRPPRFGDGTPVHEVVAAVESTRGVTLSFLARRPGEWVVRVDGRPAFPVDRFRDDAANTVVGLTPAEFRGRIADFLEE